MYVPHGASNTIPNRWIWKDAFRADTNNEIKFKFSFTWKLTRLQVAKPSKNVFELLLSFTRCRLVCVYDGVVVFLLLPFTQSKCTSRRYYLAMLLLLCRCWCCFAAAECMVLIFRTILKSHLVLHFSKCSIKWMLCMHKQSKLVSRYDEKPKLFCFFLFRHTVTDTHTHTRTHPYIHFSMIEERKKKDRKKSTPNKTFTKRATVSIRLYMVCSIFQWAQVHFAVAASTLNAIILVIFAYIVYDMNRVKPFCGMSIKAMNIWNLILPTNAWKI